MADSTREKSVQERKVEMKWTIGRRGSPGVAGALVLGLYLLTGCATAWGILALRWFGLDVGLGHIHTPGFGLLFAIGALSVYSLTKHVRIRDLIVFLSCLLVPLGRDLVSWNLKLTLSLLGVSVIGDWLVYRTGRLPLHLKFAFLAVNAYTKSVLIWSMFHWMKFFSQTAIE